MADNQSADKPRQGNRRPNNNRNRNNNNGNRNRPRRNNYRGKAKQKPLTWWQKLLKAIGIDVTKKKSNKPQPKRDSAQKPEAKKDRAPKEKTFKPKNTDELATTRLYVGNLSYEATEFELEDLFKGIGNVKSVEVIYNKHTHRSKGYAFISMSSLEDSKKAIEVLHNQPFMGRKLNISGAKERQESDNDSSED